MYKYDRELAGQIAERLKSWGFRVWIAKSGTYGFFSDEILTRVVSFQSSHGISFSGNYVATRKSGTGWQISTDTMPQSKEDATRMLYDHAPNWANSSPIYVNVEQYLANYDRSSHFTEIGVE